MYTLKTDSAVPLNVKIFITFVSAIFSFPKQTTYRMSCQTKTAKTDGSYNSGVSNRESLIPAAHDFKSYSGAHDCPRLANQNTLEVHNGPEAKSIIAVSRRRDSINSVARFKNY